VPTAFNKSRGEERSTAYTVRRFRQDSFASAIRTLSFRRWFRQDSREAVCAHSPSDAGSPHDISAVRRVIAPSSQSTASLRAGRFPGPERAPLGVVGTPPAIALP
jgi:hypothetical protein